MGFLLATVAIAGASFWGGMTYQKTRTQSNLRNFVGNRTDGNRVMLRNGNGTQLPAGMGGRGMVSGEVSKIEDMTLTVKLPDGSSKIVILSNETKYLTSTPGSKDLLKEGTKVKIEGSNSNEGITTANQVQIAN